MDDLERTLSERLRQPAPLEVPGALDAAILLEARRQLGRRRWRRHRPWVAAAVAAAALLGVLLWPGSSVERSPRPDIVDAYLLAARLQDGTAVDARWDVDGDGRVDRVDVDRLVDRVVAVERRRGT